MAIPPDQPPDSDSQPLVITEEMLAAASPITSPRVDFERGMPSLPPITVGLIFLNVCFFVPLLVQEQAEDIIATLEAGALIRERVLAGEIWRLLTAMFLHAGFDHIIGNMIALYIVGMACEHAFGPWKMAAFFLATGLGGGLASLAIQPGPSVGASGAVFGVLGAVIGFFYRHRNSVQLRDKRIGFVLLVWAIYQVVIGLTEPMIDNAAHVGGLLTGMVLGWTVWPRLLPRNESPHDQEEIYHGPRR